MAGAAARAEGFMGVRLRTFSRMFSAKLEENIVFCYKLVENTQLGGFV